MPLERQAAPPSVGLGAWMGKHAAGLAATLLGLVAVVVAVLLYLADSGEVTRMPNPWVTTPFLVVTLSAAITSLVRREGTYALAASGVGLAAAAMVVGWALVLGAVILVTAVIIVILHQLM